ncbi:O-acetyl-ADP-ribose deacetylase [Alkalibacter rhizosphaerae]|uniref:O-acetyl-ADP-ribose deacetylase n=1 Tax=Alkalibacter rhizosphaerae TaxID=2815577 RepID=A0A974XMU9_9FIRM|nr:O-acetyl-ADP-ribose deacetylase [Alkalibacter rhizosphaerae]QSX08791.1 O-acetyl-ADP-ribose deacetylase [Alkalibacter rhizosphaerae]
MPLEIIRNDITKMHVDAIVNAANTSLLGGGGVDGAIHRAAGPKLLEECRTLGGCPVGEAKITKGYDLPAKYVIHTVGPIWSGGKENEPVLLAKAYGNSLALALEYKLESVAFPLISTGAYGYPKDQALKIAISVIGDFLLQHDMLVYLVVFDRGSFTLSEKLFASIEEFIDDRFVEEQPVYNNERIHDHRLLQYEKSISHEEALQPVKKAKRKLDELVDQMDETFSQMLLRLIDEKGMTDAQAYKKANIDRKLFSKIRNDMGYKPSKPTVLAFAIALQLSLDETEDLLRRAGFALSHSSKFDIIVEYFIQEANYNVFEINEALFAFDQNLLGAC